MSRPGAVLALHGFTGRGASWAFLRESLPEGVELLAPDLLGHGAAAEAPGARFEDEVARLASLVADRPARSVVLAGYSLGARLGLGLLARLRALRQDRFAAALLVGVHPGLDDPLERAARLEADEGWARRLESEGIAAFVERWEALPLFASQSPAVVAAQRPGRLAQDPGALARSLRVLGLGRMPSWRSALGGLDLPVELMAGERDARFRALAEAIVGELPDGRLTVVPGVGHNVVVEQPTAVVQCLHRML